MLLRRMCGRRVDGTECYYSPPLPLPSFHLYSSISISLLTLSPSSLLPTLPSLPPLHHQASEQFYSSSGSEDESEEDSEGSEGSEGKKKKKKKRKPLVMDPDHRLLLRSVKPLLQSRNASVSGVEVGQWGWRWGNGGGGGVRVEQWCVVRLM